MRFGFWILVPALLVLVACGGTKKKDEAYMPMDEAFPPLGDVTDPFAYDTSMMDGMDLRGPAPDTQAWMVVNIGDRIFFGYDRDDLTPEARDILDRQAQWLQQHPHLTVTVEGHADERGTREYNLALGDRRANTVRNYLVARGVNARRLTTVSYGKERPAVPESNPSAWSQNRRGVTVVD